MPRAGFWLPRVGVVLRKGETDVFDLLTLVDDEDLAICVLLELALSLAETFATICAASVGVNTVFVK